jgi:glutaredoxin
MDDCAKASLAAQQDRAQPGLKVSRLLHWSDEDRSGVFRAEHVSSAANAAAAAADSPPGDGKAEIILFSREYDCAPCLEARRFLKANHVPYIEKDVALQDNLTQLVKQYRLLSVPVLVVKDQTIEGFDKNEYEKALGL